MKMGISWSNDIFSLLLAWWNKIIWRMMFSLCRPENKSGFQIKQQINVAKFSFRRKKAKCSGQSKDIAEELTSEDQIWETNLFWYHSKNNGWLQHQIHGCKSGSHPIYGYRIYSCNTKINPFLSNLWWEP